MNLTSYGLLALRAAGVGRSSRSVRRAATWIAREQNRDGGFSFARRGGRSGVDDTAGAVQALAAAGRRGSRAVRAGAAFLARTQNPDGGYALQPPAALERAVDGVRDPGARRPPGAGRSASAGAARAPRSTFLRSLQAPNGSVRYSRTSAVTPVWVTAQALAALARRPLPVRIRR